MSTTLPIFPIKWSAGDKDPGLVLIFEEAELITNSLTVHACIKRPAPSTTLDKLLTNLTEQKALLTWDKDVDLVAGFGQLITLFTENLAGERVTLTRFTIDVLEKVCP